MKLVLWLSIAALCACAPRKTMPPEASVNTLIWLKQRFGIVQTRESAEALRGITSRLAGAIYKTALEREFFAAETSPYKDYPWEVYLLDIPAPNAFSLGHGAIVITRGLFLKAPDEAVMAGVIAHEMSHQLLGHVDAAAAGQQTAAPAARFTLDQELAADTLSFKLLSVAGYSLVEAGQALTLNYRGPVNDVSGPPPKWLEMRMANYMQFPGRLGGNPGRVNSDEFVAAQRTLTGRR